MNCPLCGKQILVEDIHAANGLAKCRFCDEIFRTSASSESRSISQAPSDRESFIPSVSLIRCPAGTWIEETAGHKLIGHSFRRMRMMPGVCLLVILWLCFAGCGGFLFFGLFFAENNRPSWGEILFLIGFLTLLVLACLAIPYGLMCYLFNRRIVSFSDAELSVWTGPIPCGGNLRMDIGNVRQFYANRVLIRGENATELMEVHALFIDGSHRRILRNLLREEGQFYVEQLNEWLFARQGGSARRE